MDRRHNYNCNGSNVDDRSTTNSPLKGSIERGKVVRIESYGAFVELNNYHGVRGLVHISELAPQKVENVEDFVSLHDTVWVKILEVTITAEDTNETSSCRVNSSRVRRKLRLSIKDVSQDGSGRDLSLEAAQKQYISKDLEQNLNSSIGMGIARDPMANSCNNASRLVLKHETNRNSTLINGYSLVDDEEGEPVTSSLSVTVAVPADVAYPLLSKEGSFLVPAPPVRSIGRGRGTTLPAWMTRGKSDGPGKLRENMGKKKIFDRPVEEEKEVMTQRHKIASEDDASASVDSRRRRRRKKRRIYKSDGDSVTGNHQDSSDDISSRSTEESESSVSSRKQHKKRRSRRNHCKNRKKESSRYRRKREEHDRRRKRHQQRGNTSDIKAESERRSECISRAHQNRKHRRHRRSRFESDEQHDSPYSSGSNHDSIHFESIEHAERLIEQLETKKQAKEN